MNPLIFKVFDVQREFYLVLIKVFPVVFYPWATPWDPFVLFILRQVFTNLPKLAFMILLFSILNVGISGMHNLAYMNLFRDNDFSQGEQLSVEFCIVRECACVRGVSMGTCTCLCVYSCVKSSCTCLGVHVESRGWSWVSLSSSTWRFWDLSLNLGPLMGYTGWPASSSGTPISASPAPGFTNSHHHVSLFMWGLGMKLRSSCFLASTLPPDPPLHPLYSLFYIHKFNLIVLLLKNEFK